MALDLYSKATTDTLLAAKLDLAGGTMTGGLTLSASGIIFSDATYLTTAPAGSTLAADQLTAGVVTANPTAGPTASGDVLQYNGTDLVWAAGGGGGGATWGSITGTLSAQTDLDSALSAKLDSSTAASTYLPLAGGTMTGAITTASAGITFADSTVQTTAYTGAVPGKSVNSLTGSYTLASGDTNNIVFVPAGYSSTITIPDDATYSFPVGTDITLIVDGSSSPSVSIVPQDTMTPAPVIVGVTSFSTTAMVRMVKVSSNRWIID